MASVVENERLRKLLRSNASEALKYLYDFYAQSLFKLALKLTRDPDAARDIVQDTFLIIWSKRKELSKEHEKSIEYYLVRIVRNRSVSYYRRRKHIDIDMLLAFRDYGEEDNSVESQFIEREVYREMKRFILTFPKREQQCLLMKIDREMSLDEIAAELKISRKMVEKSQTRALKRLKKWAGRTK